MEEDFYIGKRVYYFNRYYQVVFARIIEINGDEIKIKSEYGKVVTTEKKAIKNNRVEYEVNQGKSAYLECRYGNGTFLYDDNKIICTNCNVEYNKEDDLELLQKTYKITRIEQPEKSDDRVLN